MNGNGSETAERVEQAWQLLLVRVGAEQYKRHPVGDMGPMVEAMMRRPALRRLYPFTSLFAVLLSESTDYPFAYTRCPLVRAIRRGWFRAEAPVYLGIQGSGLGRYKAVEWRPIGEGDAETVADLMVAALPAAVGPVILGSDPE